MSQQAFKSDPRYELLIRLSIAALPMEIYVEADIDALHSLVTVHFVNASLPAVVKDQDGQHYSGPARVSALTPLGLSQLDVYMQQQLPHRSRRRTRRATMLKP